MSYSDVMLTLIAAFLVGNYWGRYVQSQYQHEDILAWLKAINQTLREKK